MDKAQMKQLADTITEGVNEKVPGMVETLVSEKTGEITEKVDAVSTEVKELKEGMEEVIASAKSGSRTDSEVRVEDAQKYFGAYLKTLKKTKNHQEAVKAAVETGVKANEMNEGTDADGGFLVPTEFYKAVFHRVNKAGVARANCTVLPMATDTLDLTRVASGVTVGWVAEKAAYSSSKPVLARNQLVAKKVGAIIPATLELIADNMANETIWDIAIKSVTNAILFFEDTQIFTGDGSGSNITGVLNASGTNSVVTSGTGFNTLSYDNLIDMIYNIEEKDITSEANLKFYGNRTVLGQIKKLKDSNNRPIVEYVGTGPNQTTLVLGYEFVTTPVMPAMGDTAADTEFLVFGDLSAFIFGDRGQMTMDYGYRSGDWEKDIQSLKVRERIDAELVFPKALSVLKSAAA